MKIDILVMVKKSVMSIFTLQSGGILAATSNAREQLQVLFLCVQPVIYLPVSTWGNHNKIFPLGGVPAKPYHYYDPTTRGLDYQGAHRRTSLQYNCSCLNSNHGTDVW